MESRSCRARLADDLEPVFGHEQTLEAAPHDLVIVKKVHAHLLHRSVVLPLLRSFHSWDGEEGRRRGGGRLPSLGATTSRAAEAPEDYRQV
ncbi:hypothetical protein CCE02nite_04460 [Cellulosimicrobium cellulans]|uniref:Uncharacterized protein n=1 Tax=Cellulosimicrobium cellulans TaxID=1710 RepID=A0A4Y4DUX5_CELCE|nr:hypothetical protein CCE02nite_04460 [Cellulosimicrobium cellulans]